jgi:four helix bundle protein
MLDFKKLDVYQAALGFIGIAEKVAERIPRGRAELADQLRRASTSIMTNIAEGAGQPAGPNRRRFYGLARGSAYECGSIVDIARALAVAPAEVTDEADGQLHRIVSMLTKMCR